MMEGTPSQVWGGTPSQVWGYPISGMGRGVPHLRSRGIPCLGVSHVWGIPHVQGYPMSGGTPCLVGVPHLQPPIAEQHSEHLLCGRWCAFCIHAGLSCFHRVFKKILSKYWVGAPPRDWCLLLVEVLDPPLVHPTSL